LYWKKREYEVKRCVSEGYFILAPFLPNTEYIYRKFADGLPSAVSPHLIIVHSRAKYPAFFTVAIADFDPVVGYGFFAEVDFLLFF
jgi:hypothetical protein